MFLKGPCTLPMWAEPGGVWEPSALGCWPPWPAGSRRACWSLPVAPGAESILRKELYSSVLAADIFDGSAGVWLEFMVPCVYERQASIFI